MDKIARKARFLFGLWCVLYFLFDLGSSILVSYLQVFRDIDLTASLSGFHFASLGIVLLFFLPLLYKIYRLTKQYDSQKLKKVVTCMLIITSIWSVGLIIVIIVESFMPGSLI